MTRVLNANHKNPLSKNVGVMKMLPNLWNRLWTN